MAAYVPAIELYSPAKGRLQIRVKESTPWASSLLTGLKCTYILTYVSNCNSCAHLLVLPNTYSSALLC